MIFIPSQYRSARRNSRSKVGNTVIHHASATPSAGCSPSGCCNPTTSCHLPAAYLQKSNAAGPAECPPCPGSWLSRCRWCRTPQRLDKDLHATTQTQHQVQRALLLNVVIGQRPAILQLLTCKNQTLLVRRNALLVLDLGFHVVDGVGRLNVERDGFTRQRLHKDLHATTQAQHQVQSALLLNVVIGQSPAILELLACKNKTLLVRGNALLVLDLRFHVVDGV